MPPYHPSKAQRFYALSSVFLGFLGTFELVNGAFTKRGMAHSHHMSKPHRSLFIRDEGASAVPLIIRNQCRETLYPAILTQSGTGPGTGGFGLTSGSSRILTVSEDWQGRVWGRSNCSFNPGGTAPASGIPGIACSSGDCGGIVDCKGSGNTPVTLAEFTLDPGSGQSFYDISLVDGYNLPLAIVLLQHGNTSLDAIPPNLTNPSCNASPGEVEPPNFNPYNDGEFLGTNSSDPLPFENKVSAKAIAQWCPWTLQARTSVAPQGGIYVYPDMSIDRPWFDPCFSACAKDGDDADCCTGAHDSPSSCAPSAYSRAAKAVCPDAYSYAFDDQSSTFIVPSGAGFEIMFCPGARSSNILATSKQELVQLAQGRTPSRMAVGVRTDSGQHTSGLKAHKSQSSAAMMERLGWLHCVILAWICLQSLHVIMVE